MRILKNCKFYAFVFLLVTCFGCNDFLDLEPLDKITDQYYFNSASDLEAYVINLYDEFPNIRDQWNLGPAITGDDHSDNQAKTNAEQKYWVIDFWKVPENENRNNSEKEWNFFSIRKLNYFFEHVLPKKEAKQLTGDESEVNHYIGEAYFLRAYVYFKRLKNFGDFPIVTKVLEDKKEDLVAMSKRSPRNEVARFILKDLDEAINLLSDNPPGGKNRITRNAALLFKSRVALFEATFETYHKGTPRIPGSSAWPGATKDYHKGYTVDIEKEISFFTDEALKASKEVADKITLTPNNKVLNPVFGQKTGWNPYFEMFAQDDLSGVSEVIMWRQFNNALSNTHRTSTYIFSGGNLGFTRNYIETFLMENGLPIYANGSGYTGDATIEQTLHNRDYRMQLFVVAENTRKDVMIKDDSPLAYFGLPYILEKAENRIPTGYHVRKGLTYEASSTAGGHQQQTTGFIVFRGVEAYLNYIEASCLKNNGLSIDGTAQQYWKAIRERAGVDPDFNKTIAATDLDKEKDWAVYSGENKVPSLMYNIRRERRCEFIAEGMRWDDLKRWRALDMVKNYIIEGFNLWDKQAAKYKNLIEPGTEGKTPNVSSKSASKYIRPYQIIKENNNLYNGYTWSKANYLLPIRIENIRITAENPSDLSTSPIYQNPYWPLEPNKGALE